MKTIMKTFNKTLNIAFIISNFHFRLIIAICYRRLHLFDDKT